MLHFLDPDNARPYRRKNAPTFCRRFAVFDAARRTAAHRLPAPRAGLANLCVMVSPVPEGSAAHFVTLEQARTR